MNISKCCKITTFFKKNMFFNRNYRKRTVFYVFVHLCKNYFYTINEYSLTQKE